MSWNQTLPGAPAEPQVRDLLATRREAGNGAWSAPEFDSRNTVPVGLANTRSPGDLPAVAPMSSSRRNLGTVTQRCSCDFGDPNTMRPFTSATD